jgi:hypothetical protein
MVELEDGDSELERGKGKQEKVPEYSLSGSRWSAINYLTFGMQIINAHTFHEATRTSLAHKSIP